MEEGAQVRPEVAGRDNVLLIKEDDIGKHFTSILNSGINNEIMSKVFTYNMVEASRNGYRL